MRDETRRYYAMQYLRYKRMVFAHLAAMEWRQADRAREAVDVYRGYALGIDRQAQVTQLVRAETKQQLMTIAGI